MESGGNGFAFDDVVVERGGVRALDGFSAEVPGRDVTAVSGPSGSGKSTLLRLCNRLEVPTRGRVSFRGQDIAGLDPLRLRRRVGMVFQRPTPFPGTIDDNLRTASPDATRARMEDALERAALDGSWLDRDATQLSGGEAQRACVARTLITQPEVLLLDEPTSALDAAATDIFEQAVRRLVADGMTVLWVTHDAAQVRRVADRVLTVEWGRCTGIEPVARPAHPEEVAR
ncbi:ATP-binding cassette domain-containing protein [Streptomyces sp. HUCO-GS316]|uniref:ABC transporter ATP-binding protein n=1 Tax=Streptomyces sp. HUCO-GS316 TaxID=2692198 RepID=UPI001368B13A|nr:phosphate ABC transporter ATP-binding protein [Streptomyces sp. HUCO-GS316]MXM65894.1 ATP-binding cassette domain-containing protein [Streptomyces sp. HUCO-GS316]